MAKLIKKTGFFIVKLCISGLLLYLLLRRVRGEGILNALANFSPGAMLGIIAMGGLVVITATLRWKILTHKLGLSSSFTNLLQLYLVGFFFNNFLPAGLGLDVVRGTYLTTEEGNGISAFASVFAERVIGMYGIMLTGVITIIPFLHIPLIRTVFLWTTLALLIATLSIILLTEHKIRDSITPKLDKMGRIGEILSNFYATMTLYRSHKNDILKALVLSIAMQMELVFIAFIAGLGLGIDVPFPYYLAFLPVINTVSMLPISINGLGVREAFFTMLFGYIGVSNEKALILSLAFFAVSVLISLPGGIIFLLRRKSSAVH